jgi:hypothetical protein
VGRMVWQMRSVVCFKVASRASHLGRGGVLRVEDANVADHGASAVELRTLDSMSVHMALQQISADEGATALRYFAMIDSFGLVIELVTIPRWMTVSAQVIRLLDVLDSCSRTDALLSSNSFHNLLICIQTSCSILCGSDASCAHGYPEPRSLLQVLGRCHRLHLRRPCRGCLLTGCEPDRDM